MNRLTFSVAIIISVVSVTTGSPGKKLNMFHKHFAAVDKFKCKDPQPRAIAISEFLNKSIISEANLMISPDITVLHRCGQAGCCHKNKTCQAHKTETVTLVFLINKKRSHKEYIDVTAQNHTECECQPLVNNPK
ncbi:hypothetical protein TcasGA2_TC032603 [Tribolium castaneum]|uniref:Platelet-derived growth factor (PDGF) family profile domain-containing protein n=1 Tax=Tribolium castaneum TaxID=7070 RepID=A0A139WKJ0_TRICA|nr:PREDICTED: uncharacterized protein LOC103313153 [Tribolium castaneum]KYB28403.1 hypothetical protein TcasGA2_TC032603 [Tribolium castaneum]|eukprot:XP_008193892.1 PREDICTED: uncharacterized protein LOC103313153 [Tribolium castaneum]